MSKSSSNTTDVVQPIYLSNEKELQAEFLNFYKYLSDIGKKTDYSIFSSLNQKRLIGAKEARIYVD